MGLNVFKEMPYSKIYYMKRPWRWLKDVRRKRKWARQRATKGLCDLDYWNFDTYLKTIIPQGLRRLADTSHGWPESPRFPTPENYEEYLRDLANRFEEAFQDWDDYYKLHKNNNPYREAYDRLRMMERLYNTVEMDEELEKNYHAYEDEIVKNYHNRRADCLLELEDIWDTLWD